MILIRRILVFFKRDWIERTSYRSAFFLELAAILAQLFVFFHIQKIFILDERHGATLGTSSYFTFVLLGLAFSGLQSFALYSFANALRHEQVAGTLEAILLSSTPVSSILIYGSLYQLLMQSLQIAVYLGLGFFVFGVDLHQANWAGGILASLLTITSLMGLGLISAGFILVHQKGDPLQLALNTCGKLLGGVYFPVTVLPTFLKSLSNWIPLAHSLNALRQCLLNGASIRAILPDLLFLLYASLILIPLGIWYFKRSFHQALRDGTLNFY